MNGHQPGLQASAQDASLAKKAGPSILSAKALGKASPKDKQSVAALMKESESLK